MKWSTKRWCLTVCLALIIFLVVPMLLTVSLYNRVFGHRIDNPCYYYSYLVKEHPAFQRKPMTFLSDQGQQLQGYFYSYPQSQYKGLIVMAHGIGRGHESYLPEAEYFARGGYLVFGYDNTGTNESQGDKLVGLSQSMIDLHYCLHQLESMDEVNKLPLMLYGHSWGGFAATTVNNMPHSVKAIVSVAGFAENTNVLRDQGRLMIGRAADLFIPYAKLYERFLYQDRAKFTGISGLSKTEANVMLIHSDDDQTVSYGDNFGKYQQAFGDNPRFTFLPLTQRGHNLMLMPGAPAATAENPLPTLDTELLKRVLQFYDESLR